MEAAEYNIYDGHGGEEYWKNAQANAEKINSLINEICETIRARVSDVQIVQ